MTLRGILCVFFCVPIFLAGDVVDQGERCTKGSAPGWVKQYDFPLEAVPVKPSQVNVQYLLIDSQRNWEEKTLYQHYVIKTLTQGGNEKISQLTIDFDPSFSRVVVHAIRVYREGKWGDRLESAQYKLIQRETDLEKNLYNGELTVVYFLDDIREGDIIEYAYSLIGEHPLFSSHYKEWVYLQRESACERIVHRLLCHPDLSFLIKARGTAIAPEVRELSASLKEWTWDARDTLPYTSETDQPVWYNPPARVEMSAFKSWEEVVKKIYPLYVLPEGFADRVPVEMQGLIEKWKGSAKDAAGRALLALRFVQDQIRYLGIEEGMRAFKPADPTLTFQRRFGDCKDKTFLLHALLQLMEIPSKPLLVHSRCGRMLPDKLPTPFVFDHLVLQLEIDGACYYVDPTLSLQGGTLQSNFFPDYEWGLLIANSTQELVSLPRVTFKSPTEIDSFFTVESEDKAHLKTKSIFHGSRADYVRRSFAWKGLKKFEEDGLSYVQEKYGSVTAAAPLEIVDDRENNTVTISESYYIPTQKRSDRKTMKILSHILKSYLESQVNPDRDSPYDIYYPLWVRERVHIVNPFFSWKPFEEEYKQEHESLVYHLSTKVEKNTTVYTLELKHLQDHVPKHALREYWEIVDDIDRQGPYSVLIARLTPPEKELSLLVNYSIIMCCFWPVLFFISKKKKQTGIRDLIADPLGRYQWFYAVVSPLNPIIINGDFVHFISLIVLVFFINMVICSVIRYFRSAKSVVILMNIQVLQACVLAFLLFRGEIGWIDKALGFAVLCLYFGAALLHLNKARLLMIEERRSARIASYTNL